VEFSLNLSAIYLKWCAQTFPLIFGLFAIFDRNFAKIVAPSSDKYENCVILLKEQSLAGKALKTASKSACKRQRNACSKYAPLERTDLTRSVTDKKHSDKHHHIASTAGARCTIFPKLCMVIELVEAIKKMPSFFDPTHSFSYRVHGKIWPN